jgi:NADH:ubiquinone oxidoreductase subunit E
MASNSKNTDVSLIKELTGKIGSSRENLMPVLQMLVQEKHYLSEEDVMEVAREFDLSPADVFGTASFYTFLDTVPRGENIIRICKTISCHMQGKDEIIETIENALGIKVGETTHDKHFTLLTTNCLGWCHKGPVMLINEKAYPELTPQKALEIIAAEYERTTSNKQ